MTPPTVPVPEDAGNDNRSETPADEASTEAGKVTTVDDRGPKACATDAPAPGGEGGQEDDG